MGGDQAMTYGCHNRPQFLPSYPVQNGWFSTGTRIMVSQPFTMAKDCQYTLTDLGRADKGCIDCRHRSMDLTPRDDYDGGIDSPRGS